MQPSLAFPSIFNSSPYKFFPPISFLSSSTSKERVLKPILYHKPFCRANLQGFGGKQMAKLNQANATEERDAILIDESLDSSSGSSFRSFESAINKSSKWIVAGLLGLTILWKHDAEWLGVNILTVSLGAAILASGSYFSWLRVCQKLHTTNQVLVGALFGTIVSITWFWLWHAFVYDAFVSSIWVRIILNFISISWFAAFLIHVIQNWLNDEHV